MQTKSRIEKLSHIFRYYCTSILTSFNMSDFNKLDKFAFGKKPTKITNKTKQQLQQHIY